MKGLQMVEEKVKKRGGNERNARTTHPRRRARQQRALERLQSHAERSVEQQLELIADRPGCSRKEVLRLTNGYHEGAQSALHQLRYG